MLLNDPRLYLPFGEIEYPSECIARDYNAITKRQRQQIKEFNKLFDSTWEWMKLARYLIDNNRECQDLSDEELNQFRKNQ